MLVGVVGSNVVQRLTIYSENRNDKRSKLLVMLTVHEGTVIDRYETEDLRSTVSRWLEHGCNADLYRDIDGRYMSHRVCLHEPEFLRSIHDLIIKQFSFDVKVENL